MIPNTIKIDLDGERDIYTGIELSVGDINAYGLILEFYKGGTYFDITSYNLAIYATRSGSNTPIPDTGTVTGGKGYYVIKPSMYAYAGETKIEVVLTDGIMSYVTKVLHFTVRSGFSSLGGAVADEADYTVLSDLIAQAQTAITNANDAAEYANALKVFGAQYTIAPSNAVNKDRADLILTGTNDGAAINAAFTALAALRANGVWISVVFLGGDITVEETIVIPTNFRIYGNGVTFRYDNAHDVNIISINSGSTVFIDGLNMNNVYSGIHNYGTATIIGCKFEGNSCGINVESTASNTLIMGNRFNGNFDNIIDSGRNTVIDNSISEVS